MTQNSFRPRRSTIAQVLTSRWLMEGTKSKRLPAVIDFVNIYLEVVSLSSHRNADEVASCIQCTI